MATRAQIVRLTQRIDTIATRKVALRPRKVVQIIVKGEGNDAARERHYRAHPEDRGADFEIFLVIVRPKQGEHRWSQDPASRN
jgi:hypothetical protein